jgi:hypothetical protein
MACGDLFLSSTPNCDTPFQGGVGNGSNLTLILIDDIATKTFTSQSILSALTFQSGKSAWRFSGFKQSLKPGYKRVATPSGQSQYEHRSEYFVFDYSQQMKNNLERKANGRYVAFFQNALQDANAFEAMGLGVGLELIEMERIPGENGGAFKILLRTPENEYEGKMPQTVYDGTSFTTTKAIIDGWCFLPTIGASGLSILTAVAATPTAITITGTNYFANGVNSAVLKVELVNQLNGAVVPFTASPTTVTNTTVLINTPVTVAGTYKIRITTIKGVTDLSNQNLILT